MAPRPYDLACLLYDRDTSEILGDELIELLVSYYVERYGVERGEALDQDEFRRYFDLCVLHRAFKVVGRFNYICSVKKRDDFLKWIPPMSRVLREYISKNPDWRELHEVLARYMPELK